VVTVRIGFYFTGGIISGFVDVEGGVMRSRENGHGRKLIV